MAIKGQALADFIAEFTYPVEVNAQEKQALVEAEAAEKTSEPSGPVWKLFVDGSSNAQGSGAGLVLRDPKGLKVNYALRFDFKASNNEAEYEVLIAGLNLAQELNIKNLKVYCDSMLIANQVNGDFQAKEDHMAAYLQEVKGLAREFDSFKVNQIPRDENAEADNLAKLASGFDFQNPKRLPIEWLEKSSINVTATVNTIGEADNWTSPLVRYITSGQLPQDKNEGRRVKYLSNRFTMINGRLYKKGYSQPFLRCIDDPEVEFVMSQIHEGVCGNHLGGRALAQKALRQGYYWPTMVCYNFNFVRKFEKCQRFAHISHQPPAPLTSILIPWPFIKWRVDIIGPLPTAVGRFKYAVVAID